MPASQPGGGARRKVTIEYDRSMPSSASLGDAVREHAHRLGFDLVGFASAEPFPPERELILESLANGHLAGMAWITPARIHLSCDPEALLPGARSIIALGTAYANASPPPWRGRVREGGSDAGAPVGRVARY